MHQSLTGSFIYTLGRALQRTTTTECTPMLCMALFQLMNVFIGGCIAAMLHIGATAPTRTGLSCIV